jgi:hypothetical protein
MGPTGTARAERTTEHKEEKMTMKRWIVLCAVVAVGLSLCGCTVAVGGIRGSGNAVMEDYDISGFDRVDISYGYHAQITQGEVFAVTLRVDDNVLQYVDVAKSGGILHIGMKPGHTYAFINITLEATITMPELTGVALSGDANAAISGFRSGNAFAADVSGDGNLSGDLVCGEATLNLSGGSEATLSGSASDLTAEVSGASRAELSAFAVENANIEATGDSEVIVNVSGLLNVEATGDSRVDYLGNPTLGTSGGSQIRPK